ncbi:sugar ABC transporter ATP-binding protein [Granulosicoccus antarcticus]|uniref:Galactose/methyl galactoside import ATP-binding protein MglA n=1 Tax=Granulosicoccus antarcticus IMCC3135 TaxID=1192854 RepID=A0A2Z2P202_9GAMM|nr:sugar ABC transporter ATP-binding protein [Granulosicoccus antarcticus]ASJ76288.1 Galactose/methyl galactoside import ATP-binding protein MglA [Granulosicoccus antarcticus IMCC3135]
MNKDNATPLLSFRGLKKSFSGKTVVDGVSFDLFPGQVVGLVGENGAGKSTTKNMLCGLLEPTDGQIFVDGQLVERNEGHAHGISAVHQELSLFGSLTVAENMCISALPGSAMRIDWREMEKIAREQLDFLGIEIDPQASVDSLGAGKQQIVEIGKALLHADRVLILDEPTTSLTAVEREKLFVILDKLRSRGIAIIFISHFLEEIYRVCDSYIVLRDGEQVASGQLAEVSQRQLEELMVGRSFEAIHEDIEPFSGASEALRVENLSSVDFREISFAVQQGEILGIAGLMGAGRTEVAEAIFGLRSASGKVFVHGKPVPDRSVASMKQLHACYLPEDRRTNGLFLNRPVRENLSAAAIHKFIKRGLLRLGFSGERKSAQTMVAQMGIAIPHINVRTDALSGGNQQKVLLSRWMATEPEVLVLDEPTKGVDIGAKFDIHNRVKDLARKGAAVVVVSSDLPELLHLSHRILVMRRGRIVGQFSREEFDSVKIISLAASAGDKAA